MRLGWIALIIGLVITAIGGHALYEAKAAGGKRDIAYARLVEDMPGRGWYRVTGASWSLIDAVTIRGVTGATAEDVYVRVHADGMPSGGEEPAKLLVHLKDQALADYVAGILTRPDTEPRMPAENERLREENPIEGLLETAMTVDHSDQKGVRGALGERLAEHYLIIAQDRKSDNAIRRGMIFLAAGIALLALSGLLLLRRGARPEDEAAEV